MIDKIRQIPEKIRQYFEIQNLNLRISHEAENITDDFMQEIPSMSVRRYVQSIEALADELDISPRDVNAWAERGYPEQVAILLRLQAPIIPVAGARPHSHRSLISPSQVRNLLMPAFVNGRERLQAHDDHLSQQTLVRYQGYLARMNQVLYPSNRI